MKKILNTCWKIFNYCLFGLMLSMCFLLIETGLIEYYGVDSFEITSYFVPIFLGFLGTYYLYKKMPYVQKYVFLGGYLFFFLGLFLAYYNLETAMMLDWLNHFVCNLNYELCVGDYMIFMISIWPSYYFIGAIIGGIIDYNLWKKNKQ